MKTLSFLGRVILPLVIAFAVGFGVASYMYKGTVAPVSRSADTAAVTLIGNKNSMKLHLSTCDSVADMSAKNKVSFSSYSQAEKEGYKPCKICRPDLNWKGK